MNRTNRRYLSPFWPVLVAILVVFLVRHPGPARGGVHFGSLQGGAWRPPSFTPSPQFQRPFASGPSFATRPSGFSGGGFTQPFNAGGAMFSPQTGLNLPQQVQRPQFPTMSAYPANSMFIPTRQTYQLSGASVPMRPAYPTQPQLDVGAAAVPRISATPPVSTGIRYNSVPGYRQGLALTSATRPQPQLTHQVSVHQQALVAKYNLPANVKKGTSGPMTTSLPSGSRPNLGTSLAHRSQFANAQVHTAGSITHSSPANRPHTIDEHLAVRKRPHAISMASKHSTGQGLKSTLGTTSLTNRPHTHGEFTAHSNAGLSKGKGHVATTSSSHPTVVGKATSHGKTMGSGTKTVASIKNGKWPTIKGTGTKTVASIKKGKGPTIKGSGTKTAASNKNPKGTGPKGGSTTTASSSKNPKGTGTKGGSTTTASSNKTPKGTGTKGGSTTTASSSKNPKGTGTKGGSTTTASSNKNPTATGTKGSSTTTAVASTSANANALGASVSSLGGVLGGLMNSFLSGGAGGGGAGSDDGSGSGSTDDGGAGGGDGSADDGGAGGGGSAGDDGGSSGDTGMNGDHSDGGGTTPDGGGGTDADGVSADGGGAANTDSSNADSDAGPDANGATPDAGAASGATDSADSSNDATPPSSDSGGSLAQADPSGNPPTVLDSSNESGSAGADRAYWAARPDAFAGNVVGDGASETFVQQSAARGADQLEPGAAGSWQSASSWSGHRHV